MPTVAHKASPVSVSCLPCELDGEDLQSMSIEMRKHKPAHLLDAAKPVLQISENLHGGGLEILRLPRPRVAFPAKSQKPDELAVLATSKFVMMRPRVRTDAARRVM
jgi:hypothetical protein